MGPDDEGVVYISVPLFTMKRRRRPPSIPGYRHIQKDRRLPRAQSVPETHPHQSLPTPEFPPPSSQQTISPLPWYTEQKLSVTKIPLHKNWNSSPPSSRKTDTAINRYDEPWNRQHGPPSPRINPPPWHTYFTPKLHMGDSAECWPNVISKASHNHPRKYPATCHQSRMH